MPKNRRVHQKGRLDADLENGARGVLEGMGKLNISNQEREDFVRRLAEDDEAEQSKKIARERTRITTEVVLSGQIKVGVTYEDPVLKPLRFKSDMHRTALMYEWDYCMDYQPEDYRMTHLSDWLKSIFFGDYDSFMSHVKRMSAEEVKRKLDMRESLMRRSAIFHVVEGAKWMFHRGMMPATDKLGLTHVRIMEKILELGARVNVWDITGNSPLYLCCVQPATGPTIPSILTMAKMLLDKGANPNYQNRWGGVPLVHCMKPNGSASAQLLMDYGADPTLEAIGDISPMHLSNNWPNINAIFTASFKKRVKQERKEAKKTDDFKKCELCKSSADKRCTGCYFVWYCSGECQNLHWDKHKVCCKARRGEYLPVKPKAWSSILSMVETRQTPFAPPVNPKTSFQVVKVKMGFSDATLNICSKDKLINGVISVMNLKDAPAGHPLCCIVKAKGFMGSQGYFSSILKKGVLHIHPDILPPETW